MQICHHPESGITESKLHDSMVGEGLSRFPKVMKYSAHQGAVLVVFRRESAYLLGDKLKKFFVDYCIFCIFANRIGVENKGTKALNY